MITPSEKYTTPPATKAAVKSKAAGPKAWGEAEITGFFSKHGIAVKREERENEVTRYILTACPFNADHAASDPAVTLAADGTLGFKCFHNSCAEKHWGEFREYFEPGYKAQKAKAEARHNGHRPTLPTLTDDSPTDTTTPFNLTDYGNAQRLAAQHGEYLKFVAAWGYCAWSGARWERGATGAAMRLAKDTVRSIYAEAAEQTDDEERKATIAWATRSESESKLNAMLGLAESESEIEARPAEFDADPLLLNCANGTLDLRTGTLRPHNPSDKLTRITGTPYDDAAHCPTWLAFLTRTFAGNQTLIDFVQRAAGYTLTGDTGEQCLIFCYGTGANGKSTFLETLRAALGDYGQTAEFSTFLAQRGEGARNDIARMAGTRFIAAIEAGEGRRLNEPILKTLTGGDTVTARFLFKELFEYRPAFKLWLAANHKPVIRGTDNAIWRRIRMVPFTVTIPEGERDGRLPAKLRDELPGILAWAVRGCLEWQRQGLGTPAEVKQATEEYRSEQDVLAGFLADCCTASPDALAPAGELHKAFVGYAGEKIGAREFKRMMTERGYKQTHDKTGNVWKGVGLLDLTTLSTGEG